MRLIAGARKCMRVMYRLCRISYFGFAGDVYTKFIRPDNTGDAGTEDRVAS